MTARRVVRVNPTLLVDLDRLLPEERGPDGRPSRSDFLVVDLLTIVDFCAEHFDDLVQHIHGRPDYRLLVTSGRLVPVIAVVGQQMPDGSVELLSLHLDLDALDDG